MEINPLERHVKASDISIDRLEDNKGLNQQEKVEEVSRQFEAILLRQILTEGQKPMFHSKYDDQSISTGIYKDMMTEKLADGISRSGEFGLARCLQQNWLKEISAEKDNNKTTEVKPK